MRVAIISDIHGNLLALNAVLADLAPLAPDRIVCLGDAIQGGPQPAETVARLRGLGCPVVMGNADDYLATGADSGAEPTSEEGRRQLEAVRAWQLAQLAPADLQFILAFRPTVELPLDGGWRLLCYHGSPRSYDDVIVPLTPDDELHALLEPRDDTVYAGGHTHVQFMRHLGSTFHLNPGSVGFAWRHGQGEGQFRADPWAEYALLTAAAGLIALEFRRVPFDAERLIAIYRASGRPYSEERILMYGGERGPDAD
jgi:predicted phosphodiesterase